MIYTRYAIEVIVQVGVVVESSLIPTLTYENSFKYDIKNDRMFINNIMYMDNYGILNTNLHYYYTYEKAMEFLNINCTILKSQNFIISIKIVEVLDDIPLPLMETRKIKLKKLLCSEKK